MKTINDYAELVKEKHALNETIAPVEADETDASKAYAVGEQLILSGILYDVIAAISEHDVITTTGSGANIAPAGPISAKIQTLTNKLADEVSARAELGAHNLFDLDLAQIKTLNTSGTWNDNVYTFYGISFTVNSDYTVTFSGTAEETLSIKLCSTYTFKENSILSGCPSISGVQLDAGDYIDTGNGVSIPNNTTVSQIRIRISQGTVIGTPVTAYPMIRLATDTDTTYKPYAKTNQELTEDTNAIEPMLNVLGAKNLLPNNATSQTVSGVKFIVNSNGTVNVNGTATAQINYSIKNQIPTEWIGKSLILSGCPSGGGSDKYELVLWDGDASGALMRDFGNGASGIPLHTNSWINFTIRSGATFNDATVKPMIRPASIENDTYVPYAMTNRELTEKLAIKDVSGYSWDSAIDGNKDIIVKRYGAVVSIYGYFRSTTALAQYANILSGLPHCASGAAKSTDALRNMGMTLQNVDSATSKFVVDSATTADLQYAFNFVYLTDK